MTNLDDKATVCIQAKVLSGSKRYSHVSIDNNDVWIPKYLMTNNEDGTITIKEWFYNSYIKKNDDI